MKIANDLKLRCEDKCELCTASAELVEYVIPDSDSSDKGFTAVLCQACFDQVNEDEIADKNKWHILNETMWSEVPAIKILAFQMLHKLKQESWASDLLESIYLEDDLLKMAQKQIDKSQNKIIHKDSNGSILNSGDTVSLIKDLDVKGANFTAKRGTTVKNIALVENNAEQIEGKVEGQHIVILTKFVKKQ